MMKFCSGEETFAAAVVTTRWLPELVGRIEDGIRKMGVAIEKKAMARFEDGTVCPILCLRGRRGWELELRLRSALEDFLTLDRDETPVRLDPRLFDKEFAEKKLVEVVESRLAMVRAINESRKQGEVAEKIRKYGGKYGRYRVWEYEDGSDGRGCR